MKYLLLIAVLFCTSCNWVKQKTKATVNKSGEMVGKAGSEFADGVSEGVQKTFANSIQLSAALKASGISTGRTLIESTDSTKDNILSVYLIFNQDFQQEVTVKVFSEAGEEYGRVKQQVNGTKGDARYIDFVFDKRTNLDGKGKVTIE